MLCILKTWGLHLFVAIAARQREREFLLFSYSWLLLVSGVTHKRRNSNIRRKSRSCLLCWLRPASYLFFSPFLKPPPCLKNHRLHFKIADAHSSEASSSSSSSFVVVVSLLKNERRLVEWKNVEPFPWWLEVVLKRPRLCISSARAMYFWCAVLVVIYLDRANWTVEYDPKELLANAVWSVGHTQTGRERTAVARRVYVTHRAGPHF